MSARETNHLPHAHPDCTGEWQQLGARGSGLWRCTACDAEHPSTPESDAAADREYAFGALLRSQARQGRVKLPPPEPPPMIEFGE